MSWVCSNCSTVNDEKSTWCALCGFDRPTDLRTEHSSGGVEGKIVFSDIAVIKESVKGFFQSIKRIVTWIVGALIKIFTALYRLTVKIGTKLFACVSLLADKLRNVKLDRASREVRKRVKTLHKSRVPGERVKSAKREKKPRANGEFVKPWPEHNIRFDVDVIKGNGFVRSERAEMNGIKGYTLYKADGTSRFIRVDMLVVLNMAVRG